MKCTKRGKASSNGSFQNGKRLRRAKAVVQVGDVLTIGPYFLVIESREQVKSSPGAAAAPESPPLEGTFRDRLLELFNRKGGVTPANVEEVVGLARQVTPDFTQKLLGQLLAGRPPRRIDRQALGRAFGQDLGPAES